jgi:hypothetical protein
MQQQQQYHSRVAGRLIWVGLSWVHGWIGAQLGLNWLSDFQMVAVAALVGCVPE